MPKPCQHEDGHREPGCRVCELYATDLQYRRLWDGLPPIPAADSPQCRFRGDDLSGLECVALGLPPQRSWAPCGHRDQPKGVYVCKCKGCGPGCVGYTSEISVTQERHHAD